MIRILPRVPLWLGALLVGACAAQPPAAPTLAERPAAEALPPMIQQLLDALPHDAAVWDAYLADDARYVSEAGEVATKAELLEGFRPFPPGLSGSIRVQDPRISEHGGVATAVFDAVERQTVFDQTIEVYYLCSQVWRRDGGRWRLWLAHTAVRAQDPAPQRVDARRLRDFAGTYELGAWRYRVEARDDALFGGNPAGGEPQGLIPVGDNVFVEAGNPLGMLRIFVRGKGGKVERMIVRRKFADLEWKRLP
jgi:hypothetical protein